ncbi:MAG: hypothetical protein JSR82_04105 [Verrucomicrobia bacterium]|nr:hypothetical protein [Verrucomicrobiota bacterium]
MIAYMPILEELCSPNVRACAEGHAGVPLFNYTAPAVWYGFPPALIPIWSDGSGPNYIGVWKHWFCWRTYSFVKMYVDAGHMTTEIARTEQQLFSYIAIQSMAASDGVSSRLEYFAQRIGLSNLKELDEGTVESGDDPKQFRRLSPFSVNVPLESAEVSAYDGSFPVPQRRSFSGSSPFEFKDELFDCLPSQPSWLNAEKDKPSLFESYLNDGDLESAWFTLNSKGWSFKDAIHCGRRLAERSTSNLFAATMACWCDLAAGDKGGY